MNYNRSHIDYVLSNIIAISLTLTEIDTKQNKIILINILCAYILSTYDSYTFMYLLNQQIY